MPRFVFQLDGVLRHRERAEKEKQRELAVVLAEMNRLEAQLQLLQSEAKESIAQMQTQLVGKLNMPFLAAHRRYMLGMERRIVSIAQQMGQQQVLVDKARLALAEASKQKKILEKLREKQQQEWAAGVERQAAGALDELATQMSYRKLEMLETAGEGTGGTEYENA